MGGAFLARKKTIFTAYLLSVAATTLMVFSVVALSRPAFAESTLDQIKQRGQLHCGVGEGFPGFFAPDEKGVWHGLDIDLCRSLSVAIFGSPDKVQYLPATPAARFAQLRSGQVDLLSRSVTWNFSRQNSLSIDFPAVTFYDGQGFMVRKDLGVHSASGLGGASICVQSGTDSETNLADYFGQHGMQYKPVVFEKVDELLAAFQQNRCDAFTTDRSTLAARLIRMSNPSDYVILPDVISKAPNGPAVRRGDDAWANIVRWTVYAWLEAEELHINSANVEKMRAESAAPEVKRLLGVQGDFGKMLGLPDDWAYQIIRQIGNYGEIYDRNVASNLHLARKGTLNAQWRDGGLMYAPPFQ
jgi:general L-amino acid transport system substrate-binding protein